MTTKKNHPMTRFKVMSGQRTTHEGTHGPVVLVQNVDREEVREDYALYSSMEAFRATLPAGAVVVNLDDLTTEELALQLADAKQEVDNMHRQVTEEREHAEYEISEARRNGQADERTRRFLEEVKRLGGKRVAIGVRAKGVPRSVDFPFSPHGSVFVWPEERKVGGGRTEQIAWDAVKAAGLTGGAGNSGQHQVNERMANGYYLLQEDGTWKLSNAAL